MPVKVGPITAYHCCGVKYYLFRVINIYYMEALKLVIFALSVTKATTKKNKCLLMPLVYTIHKHCNKSVSNMWYNKRL